MKKIILILSILLFIGSIPVLVNADGIYKSKGFDSYTEHNTFLDHHSSYWKNEYWPQHNNRILQNQYGHMMHYQHRMKYYIYPGMMRRNSSRYFLRCY